MRHVFRPLLDGSEAGGETSALLSGADYETLPARGCGEPVVQAHERLAYPPPLAPSNGSGELKSVGRAQIMNGKESAHPSANLLARSDRIRILRKFAQSGKRCFDFPLATISRATSTMDGGMALDDRTLPQGELLIPLDELGQNSRTGFWDEDRNERRAVPEHQRPCRRSSRRFPRISAPIDGEPVGGLRSDRLMRPRPRMRTPALASRSRLESRRSPGSNGTTLATGTPCSVITTSWPDLTFRMYSLKRALSSPTAAFM